MPLIPGFILIFIQFFYAYETPLSSEYNLIVRWKTASGHIFQFQPNLKLRFRMQQENAIFLFQPKEEGGGFLHTRRFNKS